MKVRLSFVLVAVALGCLVCDVSVASAQLNELTTFGVSGSGGGEFSSPQGVAVDQSSGDVYVVDAGNFRVEKFDSGGILCLRSVRVWIS